MHQLVLITALSATTGLFGGGKHCGKAPHHGRRAVVASCYSASPCGATYAAPCGAPNVATVPSAQAYPTSPQAFPTAPSAPGKMVPATPAAPPAPPAPVPTGA